VARPVAVVREREGGAVVPVVKVAGDVRRVVENGNMV
jgi:hypothetical protein